MTIYMQPPGFNKQEINKAVHQSNNATRNKLFLEGNKIERALIQAINKKEKKDILIAAGKAVAYAEIRKALTPQIPIDRLTYSLEAKGAQAIKEANKED